MVDWASMSSMFPLSSGYRARRRGALKAETKAEHSMEHGSDSDLVWTLLGLKGWYTGLLIRLFHVSTERLRLTSNAVFLTRSSDRSSSLFGFSIWVRQPAEETVAASGRVTYVRACSVRGFQEAPSAENTRRSWRQCWDRLADSGWGCFSDR